MPKHNSRLTNGSLPKTPGENISGIGAEHFTTREIPTKTSSRTHVNGKPMGLVFENNSQAARPARRLSNMQEVHVGDRRHDSQLHDT